MKLDRIRLLEKNTNKISEMKSDLLGLRRLLRKDKRNLSSFRKTYILNVKSKSREHSFRKKGAAMS